MDEYLDQFLSSSSWSDVNAADRSSWDSNGTSQRGGILPSMMVNYVVDDKQSPMNLIPSAHIIESLVNEGTSLLVGGDSNYDMDSELLGRDAQSQQEVLDQEANQLLSRTTVDGNSNAGYMGLQFNNCSSNLGILNHSSPELLPIFGGSTQSPSALRESGSVGSNNTETSAVHPSIRDSHSITSIPQLWSTPPYGGVCSLSPAVGQDKSQGFALPAEFADTDANIFGNRYLPDDKNLQMGILPTSVSGQEELHNHFVSPFVANNHIPLERTSSGVNSQPLQAPITTPGGCNGAPKPRVRARRGQATDPHSIAERLRREKIAERMKNLQELMPNSNKADKASMLDEIIEYVKFLQLQVKVLSMSRLGAAGAVVPLITEGQSEGCGGLLLSPSADQGADGDSADDIAFEEEIVKLMESNVTAAMQYLQTKGLCLMPVALAAAISSKKAASSSTTSTSAEKASTPNFPNQFPPQSSNSIGNIDISATMNNTTKDNAVGLHNIHDTTGNGCKGIAVKREEAVGTQ